MLIHSHNLVTNFCRKNRT